MPAPPLQLATLVDTAPEGDEWLHEIKFDGYRIVAVKRGGDVRLYTRNANDWTDSMPAIAAAVAALPAEQLVLDGEAAVLLPDGRTSFQRMQNMAGAELVYFVFDLLEEGGEDLRALPLEARKARLAAAVGPGKTGPIRYSDHVVGDGAAFFAVACERGLEGIISKRRDAPYAPGRGRTWVKVKCSQRQELVIGGWTDPEGKRTDLGALLVGYFDGGAFRYAGKVGTGFTQKTLAELRAALAPLERPTPAFDPPPRMRAHWVEPQLVAEIQFMEWTTDGRLRHPSFQGLRRDKRADQVVREVARHSQRPEACPPDPSTPPRSRSASSRSPSRSTRRASRRTRSTSI